MLSSSRQNLQIAASVCPSLCRCLFSPQCPVRILKKSHLEEMEQYLQRSGIALSELDQLAVIHIAGTKGKGSTSALCESILRHHGFKTGFYSSPHLVVVRERIRINGDIISEDKFSKYFSEIYTKLDATKSNTDDMPKYFHFLTVMAFYVFLKEKVDAVVLEVGIGGLDDSTNIIRNPYVVGITALGLDHISILGNTIEEIATAKAGIMKVGCDAYTVMQPPSAMKVLREKAFQVKCSLNVAPDYTKYKFDSSTDPVLPIENEAYKTNASLAMQLSHSWMRKSLTMANTNSKANHTYSEFSRNSNEGTLIDQIPKNTVHGLSECFWPGRYQIMDVGFAKLYLDGAHTKESMDICVDWFNKSSSESAPKIVLFSATGDRNSKLLLTSLMAVKFELVQFVVPVAYKDINTRSDTYSIQQTGDQVSRCHNFVKEWISLNGTETNLTVHECIWDSFGHINNIYTNNRIKPSVLVTGSLYLVGGVLAIFNPNLSNIV